VRQIRSSKSETNPNPEIPIDPGAGPDVDLVLRISGSVGEVDLSWRGLFGWVRVLRRPWVLLTALALLAGAAWAARHAWAWYHFDAGLAALGRYHTDEARAHLQSCLRVWPDSAPVLLLAARAERRAGNLEEAGRLLDECRKRADPEAAADVAFEWALWRAAMGDLRSVEDSLQARLPRSPVTAPLIWEALASGYRRMCRLPEALACLDTWLRLDPDNAYAYFLRGEVHRQAGAVSRARDEYQRAVDLDPALNDARRQLARCLIHLGRYEEATGHLEALLRKTPGDPELTIQLARARHDQGRRDEAVALLDAVLRAHPGHGVALRERGRFEVAAGRFAEAEPWLRKALEALPYDYDARYALQQALVGQGRTAEAKEQLAQAQQLKDRLERINDIQTQRMAKAPFDPALRVELGELLMETGQPESAERWLLSALQLDPNLPAAHAALARLRAAKQAPAPSGGS
jgi:tetratricopeptide (TPR) repeat protein